MRLRHDPETDSAFIVFREDPSVDSIELCEDIVIDIDEDEQVVAIEIEHASAKFDVEEMRDLLAPDPAERRAAMRAAVRAAATRAVAAE